MNDDSVNPDCPIHGKNARPAVGELRRLRMNDCQILQWVVNDVIVQQAVVGYN